MLSFFSIRSSINDQDTVQELLSPLKRLKATTTTTTESTESKIENTKKDDTKPTYIVKVYDSAEEILLNTMVEFVGIFYDHPVIKADDMQTAYVKQTTKSFFQFRSIFRSQIDEDKLPRVKTLHCIQYKKLSHLNPLLHYQPTIDSNQIHHARQMLLSIFESIFPNDALLCEYLLLHLISRTYIRQPSAAYGKLSLNLSHLSSEQFQALEQILQTILPLYSNISINVNTLNTTQLMPNKNVAQDEDNQAQLKRTPLQLPFHSHLLIDETQMECGQLTTLGLNNIKLLQDLLRQQTLKYEFHVYQLDYECDIRCLIISSTKSILPSDVYIRYENQQQPVQEITFPSLTNEQLDQIRRYLTYVGQQIELDQTVTNLSSDINTHIQEDFVNMRKQKLLTSLDDFHLLLVLAR